MGRGARDRRSSHTGQRGVDPGGVCAGEPRAALVDRPSIEHPLATGAGSGRHRARRGLTVAWGAVSYG
ncbi:hypothetical protein I553_6079 [Mycobacterium xenopi 4042]|uniref:Uncharacterized protein n=1 Tax=Mycobacterium xenopi 4042 TaxID=1299334 RepID=X8BEE0_MYCXE|nr:hypothetical protein I553_6079 [Mycobacterium xenopi 4042]